MTHIPCFATGSEDLPPSIYFKNQSLLICRGTPCQMVLEMVSPDPQMTVREALRIVVDNLDRVHNIHVELPWEASDEILCNLLIKGLLEIRLIGPTPLS